MEFDRKKRYDGSYDDGEILMYDFRISLLSLFQKTSYMSLKYKYCHSHEFVLSGGAHRIELSKGG